MPIKDVFNKYVARFDCLSPWCRSYLQPEATTLVVVLPGGGSTCMAPPLYYTTNLAVERGYDVLNIEYESKYVMDKECSKLLRGDAARFLYQLLSDDGAQHYRNIVIVGKSFGTRVIARMLNSFTGPGKDAAFTEKVFAAKLMLLTPDFRDPDVVSALALMPASLLIWAGEDLSNPDDLADPGLLAKHRVIGLKGADHGFDIDGDIGGSIQLISQIVELCRGFLDD